MENTEETCFEDKPKFSTRVLKPPGITKMKIIFIFNKTKIKK